MALKFDAPMDEDTAWKVLRWQIAENTGWTLDAIDNLSVADISDYLSIQDGKAKAAR